jgi:hypothetical protein
MITLAICTGPWKATKIMSFFDVILKEIDALSKNEFFLEQDGQVIYKENAFLMGFTVSLEVFLKSQKLWIIRASSKLSFDNSISFL